MNFNKNIIEIIESFFLCCCCFFRGGGTTVNIMMVEGSFYQWWSICHSLITNHWKKWVHDFFLNGMSVKETFAALTGIQIYFGYIHCICARTCVCVCVYLSFFYSSFKYYPLSKTVFRILVAQAFVRKFHRHRLFFSSCVKLKLILTKIDFLTLIWSNN